jgi:multisubunit Na+/H+ antiporter MnhG subunit
MSLIVIIIGAFILLIGVVGFVLPSEMKKTGNARKPPPSSPSLAWR